MLTCLQGCMQKQLIADQQELWFDPQAPTELTRCGFTKALLVLWQCNDRKSVSAGSVFEDSQLLLPKVLILAYCFASGCSYEDAQRNTIILADETGVSHMIIPRWYGVS